MALESIINNDEMNLNEVLGQYCDDEIDVPTIDSKYLDLDDLKSLENENVNFQNSVVCQTKLINCS